VNADGDYYYLDATWGDPQKSQADRSDLPESYISYQYFMITEEELSFTHTIDKVYPYPGCNYTTLNYYTYTNRLFDAYDYDAVAAVMRDDFLSGKTLSTIRFSNEEAYQAAIAMLVDNEDAFRIMDGIDAFAENGYSYTYAHDDNYRTMDFML
jgi:hypothetical protein